MTLFAEKIIFLRTIEHTYKQSTQKLYGGNQANQVYYCFVSSSKIKEVIGVTGDAVNIITKEVSVLVFVHFKKHRSLWKRYKETYFHYSCTSHRSHYKISNGRNGRNRYYTHYTPKKSFSIRQLGQLQIVRNFQTL